MCIQFQGGRKADDKGHQYGPPMMIICHKLICEDYNKLDLHQFSTRAKYFCWIFELCSSMMMTTMLGTGQSRGQGIASIEG